MFDVCRRNYGPVCKDAGAWITFKHFKTPLNVIASIAQDIFIIIIIKKRFDKKK